jgi:hypothetical protein
MAKHEEPVEVYDPRHGTMRIATLKVSGPELVVEAISKGCLTSEILANAVFGQTGDRCVLEAEVILKDRNGKPRKKR